MKKFSIVLLILCLLAVCSSCGGNAPKWNGFRGVDWGATKEDVIRTEGREPDNDMSLVLPSGVTNNEIVYKTSVSKFTENAEAYYSFINGRLTFTAYAIYCGDNYQEDHAYLEQALTEMYGSPSDKGMEVFSPLLSFYEQDPDELTDTVYWLLDDTAIMLFSHVGNPNTCRIAYFGRGWFEKNILSAPTPTPEGINTNGL